MTKKYISQKNKTLFKIALNVLWILFAFWCSITTVIYSVRNPSKTQMEVLLHTPKHILLEFEG